ncbi:MAG: hypothetical protein ABI632_07255 [Pseudolysinimonas sp.]
MTTSRNALGALATGLAIATILTIAGCTAEAPASAPAASPAAGAASSDPAAGAAVALPDGFPTADVPLIPGTILAADHPGNIWGVWIASTDLPGDLAKATQLLVDAGYDNVIALPDYGDFHGTKYQVHVTAKVDPKYGSSIAYAFYPVQ